ncbi:MAG TPA: alpha/beta fold hydrolase [Sphingomicrobium sp.]|nr:alpha/beta fold hydrolase [Sphingomicrobium sp.]
MRLLLAVAIAIAAVLFAMIWSQDDIIFPVNAVPEAGPLPRGAERIELATADGETLRGVHVPPAGGDAPPRTLVLGFGGNAWNGEDVASYLHELYPRAHVVTFHYRGYRPSTGRPSAKALIADAPLVFDAAARRVKPERTVVVGFSIGSGIAATLARRRPADGLILVTPFDSLKAVAASIYPWLPVGAFFGHEIDAAGALEGTDVPVAILAAERDEIIPPERTGALRKRVPNLVFERTVARVGHNDVYHRSEFHQAMREALEAVVAR